MKAKSVRRGKKSGGTKAAKPIKPTHSKKPNKNTRHLKPQLSKGKVPKGSSKGGANYQHGITDQKMQCFFLRRKGYTAEEIAGILLISTDTVYRWDKEVSARVEVPTLELAQDALASLVPEFVDAIRIAVGLRKSGKIGGIKLASETSLKSLAGLKVLVEQKDVNLGTMSDDELDAQFNALRNKRAGADGADRSRKETPTG
jgi:hypothetical protein